MTDFDLIIQDLDIRIPQDVQDFSLMNKFELINEFNKIKKELYKLNEMVEATSEQGRELHSKYYAVLSQLKKQNML